jgi:hypothetical protein
MSNPYDRLLRLLPQHPEYIATILNENHPNYRVQLNDNSGVAMCTSAAKFQTGDRVYISNGEIKRLAPIGNSYLIEV